MTENRVVILLFCFLLLLQLSTGTGFETTSQFSNVKGVNVTVTADTNHKVFPFNSSVLDSWMYEPWRTETQTENVMWCGDREKTNFVLTKKGTVYKSVDQGATWVSMRENFHNVMKWGGFMNEDVKMMLQNPVDKEVIIFLGANVWITEDCGKNVRKIQSVDGLGLSFSYFKFHPTKRNWLLGSKWNYANKTLYVSKDLGKTWTFVADFVRGWTWALQEGDSDHTSSTANIPPDRIFLSRDLAWESHFINWQTRTEILYTDDYYKTKTVVLDRGYQFHITPNHLILALRFDDVDPNNARLYVGNIDAMRNKLEPVVLSSLNDNNNTKQDKPPDHLYTIIDTSRGQPFLHVNQGRQEGSSGGQYGNIYVPTDSTGRVFALWARNNVRNYQQCDFEKVIGLDEGVFLVNVYDPQVIASSQKDRLVKIQQYEMTTITYDNGETWNSLLPPKSDSKGKESFCKKEDGCALHLHSYTYYKFVPLYTNENSLGLVLGVGNVGTYLSHDINKLNTYLSRDGGFTWDEVLQGCHIYGIGDHGAIIVAAPYPNATTALYYSLNEGLTWESIQISESPIFITNIAVDPRNTTRNFLLSGATSKIPRFLDYERLPDPQSVMISIDFDYLKLRTCQNPENPEDLNSDYEKWVLNEGNCRMGHNATYIRRKREARCFNPESFKQLQLSHCECTEKDWECDVGYERTKEGLCQKMTEDALTFLPQIKCNGLYYYVTQGYKKVKGNTCVGGVNYDPMQLPCPTTEVHPTAESPHTEELPHGTDPDSPPVLDFTTESLAGILLTITIGIVGVVLLCR